VGIKARVSMDPPKVLSLGPRTNLWEPNNVFDVFLRLLRTFSHPIFRGARFLSETVVFGLQRLPGPQRESQRKAFNDFVGFSILLSQRKVNSQPEPSVQDCISLSQKLILGKPIVLGQDRGYPPNDPILAQQPNSWVGQPPSTKVWVLWVFKVGKCPGMSNTKNFSAHHRNPKV
jgi:hypothetical protein